MLARAAEANPSVFSMTPLDDVEQTLMPNYIRLVNHARENEQRRLFSSLLRVTT